MWFWVLGWLITILALLGNGLLVYLITFRRNLHTTTNCFVESLAVADFGAALTFLPMIYFATFHYDIDLSHAGLWYKICFTFMYCSTTNLLVLTVDVFIAVSKPLKYASFRERKIAIFLISMAWLTPLIFFTLPSALSYRDNDVFTLVFEINRVFMFQVFPSIFFVFVTFRLIYIVKKISRQCCIQEAQVRYNYAGHLAGRRSFSGPERKTLAIMMIILIITLFNITYIGGNALCYCYIAKTCVLPDTLDKIIRLFFIINVTANPIMYAFFKKDIRKSLCKLFKKPTVD